jgi:hypothetical protein
MSKYDYMSEDEIRAAGGDSMDCILALRSGENEADGLARFLAVGREMWPEDCWSGFAWSRDAAGKVIWLP